MAVAVSDPQTLDNNRDINQDFVLDNAQPAQNKAGFRHYVIELTGAENLVTYETEIPNLFAVAWQPGETGCSVTAYANGGGTNGGQVLFVGEVGAGPFTGFLHCWGSL